MKDLFSEIHEFLHDNIGVIVKTPEEAETVWNFLIYAGFKSMQDLADVQKDLYASNVIYIDSDEDSKKIYTGGCLSKYEDYTYEAFAEHFGLAGQDPIESIELDTIL